jgi:hypothetical protein
MVTHNILGYDPFTVEFIHTVTGRTTIKKYVVPLTKREIQEQYDYISFPPSVPQQLIDLKNECDLNTLENQSPEC